MSYIVTQDGCDPVMCRTLEDARQHVEDQAVSTWGALRDPNQTAERFPGVDWSYDFEAGVGSWHVASVDGLKEEWRVKRDDAA